MLRHQRSLEDPTDSPSAGWRQPRDPRTVEPKEDLPSNRLGLAVATTEIEFKCGVKEAAGGRTTALITGSSELDQLVTCFDRKVFPMSAQAHFNYTSLEVELVPAILQQNGACSTSSVDFFGETKAEIKAAKAICAACPVASICFNYALNNEEYGVWGGYSAKERSNLRSGKLVSPEDRRVSEILRQRFSQGVKIAEIAAEFKVTERTVYRWKRAHEAGGNAAAVAA